MAERVRSGPESARLPHNLEWHRIRDKDYQQTVIKSAAEHIQGLFIKEGEYDRRPSIEDFDRYQQFALATVSQYRNTNQAYKSDHNFEHQLTVLGLSLAIARWWEAKRREEPDRWPQQLESRPTDTNALAIASLLHDSQRENDVLESVFHQKHEWLAAELIMNRGVEYSTILGLPHTTDEDTQQSRATISRAASTARYHDDALKTPTPPELLIMSAADRATSSRILFSYHYHEVFKTQPTTKQRFEAIAANVGIDKGLYEKIVRSHAEHYEDSPHYSEGCPHVIQEFLDIGTALALVARDHIMEGDMPDSARFAPARQFTAVRSALLDLGLFQAASARAARSLSQQARSAA